TGSARVLAIAGLRHLAAHTGSRFVADFIPYTRQQTLPYGNPTAPVAAGRPLATPAMAATAADYAWLHAAGAQPGQRPMTSALAGPSRRAAMFGRRSGSWWAIRLRNWCRRRTLESTCRSRSVPAGNAR